jgi:hypothetical protein
MPPANALSVYTSPTTHSIPTASCNPHCDHTPGYAEGDWYLVQETIPPSLDQASASLICEGIGCPFDRYVITIDNPGHIATINFLTRSWTVTVRLQAGELGREIVRQPSAPAGIQNR